MEAELDAAFAALDPAREAEAAARNAPGRVIEEGVVAAAFAARGRAKQRKPDQQGTFVGNLRSSAVKTIYMRERRKTLRAMQSSPSYDKLANAWDETVLRVGDRAIRQSEEPAPAQHPNTIPPDVVVREAFAFIGPSAASRDGIRGTTHRSVTASCVCAGAQLAQEDRLTGQLTDPTLASFVIGRHYDCTPMKLSFGRLQAQMAPSARYVVPTFAVLEHRGLRMQWQ